MFARFALLIVLSTFPFTLAHDDPALNEFRGHVLKINGNYQVVTSLASEYVEPTSFDNVLAVGQWETNYNTTGWSVLSINTHENQSNFDQAYAAGLLEGQLTRELTGWQKLNNIDRICNNRKDFCDKLKQFFLIQLDWIYTQINSYPNDEYWHQINLLLVQLNGLIDGNQNATGRSARKEIDDPLGLFLFQVVESTGDLANRLGVTDFERRDSCSALVKILPGNKDIFISHADWSGYYTMLKVLKRYIMPLKRTPAPDSTRIPGGDVIFSSYPGTLHSIDDFYMTYPANMVVIETTIENNNVDLYHNILPISVPEWMRVVVANRLANSGKEWVDKFYVFNDGTYNNEWMVADYKQFTPNTPPKAGFLTVSEQMVTYYRSVDMTDTLNKDTYWASYNNVYFPDFRDISGEERQVAEKGPELYSWANSSRARIFRRDHNTVVDMPTMVHMMRYNNFTHDPLSLCSKCINPPYSAELTIAARCDLNEPNVTYPDPPLGYRIHGATDAKITGYEMIQDHELVAIAGPTTQGQPPFVWTKSSFDKTVSHIGHPDEWNFKEFTPVWNLTELISPWEYM